MAYLDTLTSHNTQLQGLINKANALPDAGGGGASVDTCTVIFTMQYGWHLIGLDKDIYLCYHTIENNKITPKEDHFYVAAQIEESQMTITDCICGSIITIISYADSIPYGDTITIDGTAELVVKTSAPSFAFHSPTVNNEICNIRIE